MEDISDKISKPDLNKAQSDDLLRLLKTKLFYKSRCKPLTTISSNARYFTVRMRKT